MKENTFLLINCRARCTLSPDGIPEIILLHTADLIAPILSILFKVSLEKGHYPKRLKLTFVSPIHKSGSKSNIRNYRGVAVMSPIGKIFDKIVHNSLSKLIRGSISIHQHGFMPKRSTTSILLEFTNTIIENIENRSQTDCIYTDFTKAFDRVQTKILVKKLENIGIIGNILKWFESSLTGRKQKIKCDGKISERVIHVLSGTGQGTSLGGLLFLIVVNDCVPHIKKSNIRLFADDFRIFKEIKSMQDCEQLQSDLNSLSEWCKKNLLELNYSKCSILSFTRKKAPTTFRYTLDGEFLPRTEEVMDLGILMGPQMSFNKHIDIIVSRARARLGFVMRVCRDFNDPYTLKTIYCSFVRSILDYCCVIWNPSYNIHISRIESIQKKFVKYALRKLNWNPENALPPYEDRCKLIGLETLETRRSNMTIVLAFDLIQNNIETNGIIDRLVFNEPIRQLRIQRLMITQTSTTNYSFFKCTNRICRIINQCVCISTAPSRDSLKRQIKNHTCLS